MNYEVFNNKINDKSISIAIWGCGFVGTTNMLYLAKSGFRILGIDTNPSRIEELREGKYNVNSDETSDETILDSLTEQQKLNIRFQTDLIVDCVYQIHMLCLPTEKDFKPYNEYIIDVVKQIAKKVNYEFLLIIECSMAPKWIDTCIVDVMDANGKKIGSDYLIGAAPRRDLFGDPQFSLSKTRRVIGGNSKETLATLLNFYSTFCEKLVPAKDHYCAVFSKIVENTYRCFNISLANQLNYAFPDYDITHILDLASTKWNMNKYHPSFGIGSYCIPLAPMYILDNIKESNLEIFNYFIEENNNTTEKILLRYMQLFSMNAKIAVLGISSIENVAIFNCSIGIKLADLLINMGFNVFVHDFR
jgi:nucleotide sugar dehydrogenase